MASDLGAAVLGWLVTGAGTRGARWAWRKVAGQEQERALRGVVDRAIERAAEIAPAEERERLRLALVEHRAPVPDAAAITSLRTVISHWVGPLTEPVEALDGASYLSDHGIDPDHLVNVLDREIRDGIEEDAVRGGPLHPIAGRFRHDDLTGLLERARGDIGELGERIDAVIDEPVPEGPPRQLPHAQPEFTGRTRELAALREQAAARHGTLVISAVSGTPGVGKSALARHAAHQLADHYPDAQLFEDLRGADTNPVDPGDVLGGFLRALGRRRADIPARADERAANYRSLLSGKRALVVLDNAADEAQVRPLLPGTSTCLVLVTSRRELVLDGAHTVVLDAMDEAEGRELFTRLVGDDRVAAEPDAAADVIRLCGGLPLAIRIAAARLRTRPRWPIAHLAERLSEERRRLAELRIGNLDVRASFAVSYRDLTSGEAALFRRLGVVPAAEFDARLAAALAAGATEDADLVLEALADAHLVDAATPGRHRIHDLLRLFARERLEDEEGAEEASHARYTVTRWYAEMVPAAVRTGLAGQRDPTAHDASFLDRQAALAWLDAEWQGAAVAAENAATAGALDDAECIVAGLWNHRGTRDRLAALDRLNRHVYEAAQRRGHAAAASRAATHVGTAAVFLRRGTEALDWYGTAARIADAANLHGEEAHALTNLVNVHLELGDEAAARRVVSRLPSLIGKTRGTEWAAIAATGVAGFQPTAQKKREWLTRARDLAVEADAFEEAATAALGLGVLAAAMGRREEARRRWAEAIEYAGRQPRVTIEAHVRHEIAKYCLDYSEARTQLEAALKLHRQVGNHSQEAATLLGLGRVNLEEGLFDEARRRFEDALTVTRDLEDARSEGSCLLWLAVCDELQGRTRRAESHARQAYQILRAVDEDAADQARAMLFRARKANRKGRPRQDRKKRPRKRRR